MKLHKVPHFKSKAATKIYFNGLTIEPKLYHAWDISIADFPVLHYHVESRDMIE
jgi:hypothetical protein